MTWATSPKGRRRLIELVISPLNPATPLVCAPRHAGTSPQAYLRGVRLAVARRALEAGASVAAASEAAGFNSELQLRRAWSAAGWPGSPSGARRQPQQA